jgi:hypothetical protein
MGSSPGFASPAPDCCAWLGLAFAAAPPLKGLTRGRVQELAGSLCKRHAVRRGTRPIALPPLVGTGFQDQCPPLSGSFPPFGRPTGFAIGRHRVLSLAGGSPPIQAGFHVPDPTRVPARGACVVPTGLSPALVPFSKGFGSRRLHLGLLPAPRPRRLVAAGLGWSPFARRY